MRSGLNPLLDARIRMATAPDAPAFSHLVQATFHALVAPDWQLEAQNTFLADTTPEKLRDPIATATFAAMYVEHDDVRGVILLPRPNLVQLCFVDTAHLRQGIGTALWEAARMHLEKRYPEVKTVELNASPYAVAAYQAMGFFPISKPFRRRGSVATRMACWLPGRALERSAV
jgi:GNAT superfamily N-acetyltransferase